MKYRSTYIWFLAAFLLGMLLLPASLTAQPRYQPGADEAAARASGCAACGTCGVLVATLSIAMLAVHILILVWVARDAKARGVDSPVLWLLLIVFTGLIGLIVYICVRPPGATIQCPHCHNKRLEVLAKCPHCGNT
jgi:hypothetical protein